MAFIVHHSLYHLSRKTTNILSFRNIFRQPDMTNQAYPRTDFSELKLLKDYYIASYHRPSLVAYKIFWYVCGDAVL
jgi:hypothetical protein